MIKHRLFSKGEYIHALISNTNYPNIVFPVRAIIHDVKFDEKMPKYQIRIVKFYDDISFLKRYFFDTNFEKNFKGGMTKFRFKREMFSTKKELAEHLEANAETYLITVDSVMCTKTQNQIMDLYNNIQDFLIEKNLRDLYELSTRPVYKNGKYFYETKGVFTAHLKKFLGDRLPKIKDYFDRLLYRPNGSELDDLNM
jgi:hypothetical protein